MILHSSPQEDVHSQAAALITHRNSSQRLPTQLLPAVPRLALLGQVLSSLVSVVCDLSGGPLDDLLQLGLQTLHDGLDGVGDLLQLG